MDSRQPKEGLLPVCDGQANSEVVTEIRQQHENAIMKALSNGQQRRLKNEILQPKDYPKPLQAINGGIHYPFCIAESENGSAPLRARSDGAK